MRERIREERKGQAGKARGCYREGEVSTPVVARAYLDVPEPQNLLEDTLGQLATHGMKPPVSSRCHVVPNIAVTSALPPAAMAYAVTVLGVSLREGGGGGGLGSEQRITEGGEELPANSRTGSTGPLCSCGKKVARIINKKTELSMEKRANGYRERRGNVRGDESMKA